MLGAITDKLSMLAGRGFVCLQVAGVTIG